MTAPTQRWWAPQRPGIGPDPVDLAMLEATGDNPRLDLGASVLAAHRVGAAACDAAAASPLLDETGLIDHLARARELLAPTMINSVSKSVEGEGYASLLVRDVLDDAEEGALDLYRAAVARGVAPPMAAARVGAVFGVSKAGFGKYRTLAVDPRANPIALADAADRALFDFVEKLAEEETAGAKESVSKITPEERRARVAQEARDDQGRFAHLKNIGIEGEPQTETEGSGNTGSPPNVSIATDPAELARLRGRYGLGGTTAPSRVGETAEEVARRERAERAQKAAQARRAREAAAARPRPASRPVNKPPGERTIHDFALRRTGERVAPERQAAERTARERTAATLVSSADRERTEAAFRPKGETGRDLKAHELLSDPQPGYIPVDDRPITQPVGFAMGKREAEDLLKRINAHPDRQVKIGRLLEKGSSVHELADPEHIRDIRAVARDAEGQELEAGRIKHIPKAKLDSFAADKDAAQHIFDERMKMARRPDGGVDLDRLPHVVDDFDGNGVRLIPSTTNTMVPEVYVFTLEGARGHHTHGAQSQQWTPDPNQTYEVATSANWKLGYSDDGYIVHMIPVRATDVNKADERPWVATERRDDFGRWVASQTQIQQPAVQPEQVQTETREQRHARAQRARQAAGRRARPQPARRGGLVPTEQVRAAERQAPERRAAERGASERGAPERRAAERSAAERVIQQVRSASNKAVASRAGHRPTPGFVFDDDTYYRVMDERDWHQLHHAIGSRYADDEEVVVTGEQVADAMVNDVRTPGEDGPDRVIDVYEMADDPTNPNAMTDLDRVDPGPPGDEASGNMQGIIDNYLDKPSIAVVRSTPAPTASRPHQQQLSVNTNRPAPVYVIELNPDLEGTPYYALVLDDDPARVVNHDLMDPDGTITSYAVPVVHYRQMPLLDDEYDE